MRVSAMCDLLATCVTSTFVLCARVSAKSSPVERGDKSGMVLDRVKYYISD